MLWHLCNDDDFYVDGYYDDDVGPACYDDDLDDHDDGNVGDICDDGIDGSCGITS